MIWPGDRNDLEGGTARVTPTRDSVNQERALDPQKRGVDIGRGQTCFLGQARHTRGAFENNGGDEGCTFLHR
jgi:hypothetical protein